MNATITEERLVATIDDETITAIVEESPLVAHFADETVIVVREQESTYTAGQALSALRAVYADGDVYYANHADLATINVVGITTNAASPGDTVTVQTSGALSDGSWSWTPGPIYVGSNGALTQIAPVVGYLMEVARAVSATDIVINLQQPIIRA